MVAGHPVRERARIVTVVAAVDCGTNSIRLLISDISSAADTPGAAGVAKADLVREMRIVRLGQGVDRTGRLDEAALERTLAACAAYARTISDHGAAVTRFCATSATRDATNAAVFSDAVRHLFGVPPDVLTGGEEAALSYAGATRDLSGLRGPLLVADVGGGSTELVVGTGQQVEAAVSLDIGSVRMTERHLTDDPPTPAQVQACRHDIDAALDGCGLDLATVRSFVGVAGTVTTLAAHAFGLGRYDSMRIHHAAVTLRALAASCADIVAADVDRRKAMPFMHPGRADVIGGGVLIVQALATRLSGLRTSEMVASEHDILDGIAWSLA